MANAVSEAAKQEMTTEQKAVLKKVQDRAPGAKLFETRSNGNYYGPVLYADKKNVVQQVGSDSYVVHPRQHLGPLPTESETARSLAKLNGVVVTVQYTGEKAEMKPADPDRWYERQARTPASREHSDLAKQVLGARFEAFNPPPLGHPVSPKYEGVIAAVTDDHLIQRINSRTAIVHNVGPEVAKQFGAGQEAVVSYDNGRFKEAQVVERQKAQEQSRPARERTGEARSPDDAARAASWVLAKNIAAKSYGSDIKLYSAARVDAEAGKFRGPIVAMTDHHVVQRVGQGNSFVAHAREDLKGDLQTGRFTQINYDHGKAQAQIIERGQNRGQGQNREQGQAQERPVKRPPLAQNRERQSQGMSR